MEAPNVSEGLRPTRLLPGRGDPSLTIGAQLGRSLISMSRAHHSFRIPAQSGYNPFVREDHMAKDRSPKKEVKKPKKKK